MCAIRQFKHRQGIRAKPPADPQRPHSPGERYGEKVGKEAIFCRKPGPEDRFEERLIWLPSPYGHSSKEDDVPPGHPTLPPEVWDSTKDPISGADGT